MPKLDFKYTKEDLYQEMAEALKGEPEKEKKPNAIQALMAKTKLGKKE
jgi:hypothetical protein